jgi:hypothetical protein
MQDLQGGLTCLIRWALGAVAYECDFSAYVFGADLLAIYRQLQE